MRRQAPCSCCARACGCSRRHGLIKGSGSAEQKVVWARELLLQVARHDIKEGSHAVAAPAAAQPACNLFGKTVLVEGASQGVKTGVAEREDAHMARESAAWWAGQQAQ